MKRLTNLHFACIVDTEGSIPLSREESFLTEGPDDVIDLSSMSLVSTSECNMERKLGKRRVALVRSHVNQLQNGKHECKMCATTWGERTSTSTMKRHFASCHPETYNEMYQDELDSMRYLPYPNAAFEKAKKQAFETALLRSIVVDQLAFALVESETFREVIAQVDPRLKVPCRQTISKRISDAFNTSREEVKKIIADEPGKISIASDVWTACNQTAFLGVTAHWINSNWEMKLILLDIQQLSDVHTGEVIANAIVNILREFNIGSRLLALTTDNGSNMVSMGRKLGEMCAQEFENDGVTHVRCVAHVLNLAAKAGLAQISTEVKKARVFASKLHNSVLLVGEMQKIAAGLEMKHKMPQVDVVTRWNSTFLMLRRLEEIRLITDVLVVKRQNLAEICPTNDEWIILKVSTLSI